MAFKSITEIIHGNQHILLTYKDLKKYLQLFNENDKTIILQFAIYRVLHNSVTWEYNIDNNHFDYEIGGLCSSYNKWIMYCDDLPEKTDLYYKDIDMYYWEIVLLHEMIHAIVGSGLGHGIEWKNKCAEICKTKFPNDNLKEMKLYNIFMLQIGKSTK